MTCSVRARSLLCTRYCIWANNTLYLGRNELVPSMTKNRTSDLIESITYEPLTTSRAGADARASWDWKSALVTWHSHAPSSNLMSTFMIFRLQSPELGREAHSYFPLWIPIGWKRKRHKIISKLIFQKVFTFVSLIHHLFSHFYEHVKRS